MTFSIRDPDLAGDAVKAAVEIERLLALRRQHSSLSAKMDTTRRLLSQMCESVGAGKASIVSNPSTRTALAEVFVQLNEPTVELFARLPELLGRFRDYASGDSSSIHDAEMQRLRDFFLRLSQRAAAFSQQTPVW